MKILPFVDDPCVRYCNRRAQLVYILSQCVFFSVSTRPDDRYINDAAVRAILWLFFFSFGLSRVAISQRMASFSRSFSFFVVDQRGEIRVVGSHGRQKIYLSIYIVGIDDPY